MLPTFVISALGFNVRVAAVISHAPCPGHCLHLSISLFFFCCSSHTGSSVSFGGSFRCVVQRGGWEQSARLLSWERSSRILLRQNGRRLPYAPPPTPAFTLSSQCPRVCACDARCRASIGRRLCPLFIIKGERRGERLPLRVRPIYIFSWNLIAHSDANIQPRRGKNQSCCY